MVLNIWPLVFIYSAFGWWILKAPPINPWDFNMFKNMFENRTRVVTLLDS